MINAYVTTLITTMLGLRDKITRRVNASDDTGASVLEMVVIAAGVLALAIAVIAAITSAVNSRIAQIS